MQQSLRDLIKERNSRELDERLLRGQFLREELFDNHGQSLLIYALRHNRLGCALACAKYFWGINHRNTPALHVAVQKNAYLVVCALVKAPLSLASGSERRLIREFLLGRWKRLTWSPSIHWGTPPEFHVEAVAMAQINWRQRWFPKDVLGLILEALLELHRREYRQKPSLYLVAQRGPRRCVAITRKGERCKQRVQNGKVDRCYRH